MTLGERLDNTLADGLVALGVGLRRAWIVSAKLGDRVLGGSPVNAREAQRFLTMGGSERLAEMEAEREVWELASSNNCTCGHPASAHVNLGEVCEADSTCTCKQHVRNHPLHESYWDAAAPNEWLSPIFPSGQPVDLLDASDGRAVHPLYRELQEQHERVIPDGPAYRIGQPGDPTADVHLCKTWDGKCHCALVSAQRSDGSIYTDYIDDVVVEDRPVGTITHGLIRSTLPSNSSPGLLTDTPAYRRHREFNTMPNWSYRTPQTSAPGHRSEAPVEVDDSPGVASTPRDATPGHLNRFAAADWLEATLHATGVPCGAGWVLALVDGVAERLNTPGRPTGVDDHPGDAGGAVQGSIR